MTPSAQSAESWPKRSYKQDSASSDEEIELALTLYINRCVSEQIEYDTPNDAKKTSERLTDNHSSDTKSIEAFGGSETPETADNPFDQTQLFNAGY